MRSCLLVRYAGFNLSVREQSDLEAGTELSELILVYDFQNQLNNHFHLSTGQGTTPSSVSKRHGVTKEDHEGEITT
jgi:hypothetical protein